MATAERFLDDADSLESAVFQALGAASACWDNLEGAGVFQSERARAIGEELLERIGPGWPGQSWCRTHARVETTQEPYAVCGDCGHVWVSAWRLWAEHALVQFNSWSTLMALRSPWHIHECPACGFDLRPPG